MQNTHSVITNHAQAQNCNKSVKDDFMKNHMK